MKLLLLMLPIFFIGAVAHADPILLQQSNMTYLGAFRVPHDNLGGTGTSFGFGGGPIAFNPARNSLFIGTRDKKFAEISIPTAVNSGSLGALNTATLLQSPLDPTNGNWDNIQGGTAISNGGAPGGILYYGGKLIGSVYGYYDASNVATVSHFTSSPDWSTTGTQFSGFYTVGSTNTEGYIGGYMATIPPEWQSSFGGPALTGQAAVPIITRTSAGPSVSVFDPALLGVANPVPVTPLVRYDTSHMSIGTYDTSLSDYVPSIYYNVTTSINGVVFPVGSRTVLFFGKSGIDNFGYGYGTSIMDQAKNRAQIAQWFADNPSATVYQCDTLTIPKGAPEDCTYDPAYPTDHGGHAYPRAYFVWAYDANDLLAAKSGNYVVTAADEAARRFISSTYTQPFTTLPAGNIVNIWNVKPYQTWQLNFPIGPAVLGKENIVGAAYDPSTQRIYISQYFADMYLGTEPDPLVQVFQLDISPPSTPGTCGPSNGLALSSAPTVGLCTDGTASAVSGTGPWSWTCAGSGGGSTSSCSASVLSVDGVCASYNGGAFAVKPTRNLCTFGSPSVVSGVGPWSWTCGSGGNVVQCGVVPTGIMQCDWR